MKRITVFIIEKEAPVANLIRYQLLSRQAKQVQVFPSISECMYFMQKRSVPDFLIADLDPPEINAPELLKTIIHSFPGVSVVFLSPFKDDSLVSQLMENGATDCIYTSGRMETWIHELVKNMEFLMRKKSQVL